MNLNNQLIENYNALQSNDEKLTFINDILNLIHYANMQNIKNLVKNDVISEESAHKKLESIDNSLKQVLDTTKKHIKLDDMAKKAKEFDNIKQERDNLKRKVEMAQGLIDEKDKEIDKTKKAIHNKIKKNLQSGRDRIIYIGETSNILGEKINNNCSSSDLIEGVNTLRDHLQLLTNELISLNLWDQDDEMPKTSPIELTTKTTKSKAKSKEKQSQKEEVKEVEKANKKDDNDINHSMIDSTTEDENPSDRNEQMTLN